MNENINNKQFNKPINNQKEEFEKEISTHKYNLFQQFFIIGIEPKIIYLFNKIDINNIMEPMIGPQIISKYPNIDLPYINIPDSMIIDHCFPNGFKNSFIEYDKNNLKEKLGQTHDFIFSLDNYQSDKDSPLRTNKLYYICYFFYEKLDEYINVNINIKKNINLNNKNKNILIPKVICLSCFYPYVLQSKSILHYLKKNIEAFSYNKYLKKKTPMQTSNNLTIEKIIEGLIFNLPGLPRANFIMKISKNNFILEDDSNNASNIYEKKETKEIIFENSPINKRPKPIINYALLMKFFRVEEIFEIVKLILLEEPILFFSNNIEYLTYVIEGLVSLIYPFEYPYPVIAILPENNYSFIKIFKSFIFGINHKYSEDIFVVKGINLDQLKNVNVILIENRFNNLINNNEKEKEKTPVILNLKPNNSKCLAISYSSLNNTILEIKDSYLKKKTC